MSPILDHVHPSVLNWVVKNSDRPENDSTIIERLLITFALLISIALPLTRNARFLSRSLWPTSTGLVVWLTMLLTCLALNLSIAVVILGFQKRISLDAFSGAIFALSPALLSVRVETFQFYFITKVMEKRRSLRIPLSEFRYVRYSNESCGVDKNRDKWRNTFGGLCKRRNCTVKIFIRQLPQSRFYREQVLNWPWNTVKKFFNCFCRSMEGCTQGSNAENQTLLESSLSDTLANNSNEIENQHANADRSGGGGEGANAGAVSGSGNGAENGAQSGKLEEQWHGLRTGHSLNCVELRDKREGMTAWWWFTVSGSYHLLTKPSIFELSGRRRVLNAFILLSDIISIGDMVLYYRGDFIKNEFCTNQGIRAALTATPLIICNLMFEELGIGVWGPVEWKYLTEYPTDDNHKLYGILFLILTEKSNLFADLSKDSPIERQNGTGLELYELTDDVQTLDEENRLPLMFELFTRPEGEKQDAASRCSRIFGNMRTGLLGEPKRRARLSAQEILDDMKEHENKAPEQLAKLMENRVDKWLNDWGIRKHSFVNFE